MSQISRAWHDGATTIDVRLLAEIEGALMVDGEPGVSVVAPMWARVEAHGEACTDPEFDAQLVADTQAAMGWLTFSMQAGFFIGPAIAGLALQWIDIRTDIAVTTVLAVFALPGAMVASATRQSRHGFSVMQPLRALIGQRSFVPVIIGLVAATLAWGTVGAFLPIFGRESLGLPGPQVGLLLALQAVANGLARLPGGRLVDRARHLSTTGVWLLLYTARGRDGGERGNG